MHLVIKKPLKIIPYGFALVAGVSVEGHIRPSGSHVVPFKRMGHGNEEPERG